MILMLHLRTARELSNLYTCSISCQQIMLLVICVMYKSMTFINQNIPIPFIRLVISNSSNNILKHNLENRITTKLVATSEMSQLVRYLSYFLVLFKNIITIVRIYRFIVNYSCFEFVGISYSG